jgi:hypothetical protein
VSTDEHKDKPVKLPKRNFVPPHRRSYPWKAYFNEKGLRCPLFDKVKEYNFVFIIEEYILSCIAEGGYVVQSAGEFLMFERGL